MDNGSLLSKIRHVRVTDWLVVVIGFWMVILASPYIERQFAQLTKPGDIFWNIVLDLVVLHLGFLAMWLLMKLLRIIKLLFDFLEVKLRITKD